MTELEYASEAPDDGHTDPSSFIESRASIQNMVLAFDQNGAIYLEIESYPGVYRVPVEQVFD